MLVPSLGGQKVRKPRRLWYEQGILGSISILRRRDDATVGLAQVATQLHGDDAEVVLLIALDHEGLLVLH